MEECFQPSLCVILLDALHRELAGLQRPHPLHRGFGGGEVGGVGNLLGDGRGADQDFVGAGF